MGFFLGIDGGQSHTTALLADARGRIVGVGHAGESNHTRAPGGRERLIKAVTQSVGQALAQAGWPAHKPLMQCRFASAHLAMTGEPQDKIAIVHEILTADHLAVAHDAPGALAGAHAGGAGIIVLAGTGSVACGETFERDGSSRFVRVGGRGYLFADEGSAFAIARQAVSLAMRRADRVDGHDALQTALLKHFKRAAIEQIIEDVYAGDISRERLASFTAKVAALAERGEASAQKIIDQAASDLAELAIATAQRLQSTRPLPVSYGGGVFKSRRLRERFINLLAQALPASAVIAPRFGPDAGALLLAFRQAGKKLTPTLLNNIASTLAHQ